MVKISTWDRGVDNSSLNEGTVLCPSTRHDILSLVHGAMGLSAVFVCGISWLYSLVDPGKASTCLKNVESGCAKAKTSIR